MVNNKNIIFSSGLFGEYSPYYAIFNGKAKIFDLIKDVIEYDSQINYNFDISAVLSLLNFGYILGDRTLVAEINKVPWHADITLEGEVIRRPPIPHGDIFLDEEKIAKKMHEILSRYLSENILEKHSTIWLTLSGGYDSRITAGLLKQNATSKNDIKVLNWGLPDSLDVVYAKKIAEHYSWEYIYIPYDKKQVADLIGYTVEEGGAEISWMDYNPIEINSSITNKIAPNDAIIFSHYGNGIGRGFYSGQHISKIRLKKINNPFFLFNTTHYNYYKKIIELDRAEAWANDITGPIIKTAAQNELDMHENYMRRMLTKRFSFCHKYDPFANVDLVKFVYSLSPKYRNIKCYQYLLQNIDQFLYELPWDKTKKSFSGIKETNNLLAQKQHNKWLDFLEFYEEVRFKLLKGHLAQNNILNYKALEYVLSSWKKNIKLSHLISRLYGIELFIEKYNLSINGLNKHSMVSEFKSYWGAKGYNFLKNAKNIIK